MMNDREKTTVVLAAVAVFFGGYLLGAYRWGSASEDSASASRQNAHHHDHGVIELSNEGRIPRVDLVVHKDAMSGRNLEIVTENFRFAPEHASSEHLAGEGHAHLYLDGEKIARVYGHWFHVPEPGPGTHSVRVTLNANSHQDLAVGGELIADTETLSIAEP